jgi:hypothetical protein
MHLSLSLSLYLSISLSIYLSIYLSINLSLPIQADHAHLVWCLVDGMSTAEFAPFNAKGTSSSSFSSTAAVVVFLYCTNLTMAAVEGGGLKEFNSGGGRALN